MTEEAKTTESGSEVSEATATATPETSQATQPEQKSIFDGFTAEDKAYLENCYKSGAEKAAGIANRTLSKVKRKVGWVDFK